MNYELHIPQPPQDIIEVGNDHQQDEDGESHIFCLDHKVLTGFATRDHLIDQEEYMTAV